MEFEDDYQSGQKVEPDSNADDPDWKCCIFQMEFEDDYRSGQEVEVDSDADDPDCESQLSQWLGELENYAKGLEPGDTSTVRRRQKAVVTPKMAMESFRYSFLSENQDVNFDAILGELCELENQLDTAQTEMAQQRLAGGGHCLSHTLIKDENRDSGNDLAQSELDALATEITRSLGFKHKRPMADLDYFHTHYPGDLGGYSDAMLDVAETDSAFSESASLPSSESFTSMVTVSSSAETAGMGDNCSMGSVSTITSHSLQCDTVCPCMRFANTNTNSSSGGRRDRWTDIPSPHPPSHPDHEEHRAILQVEKIRIALEKIKEAKIKKLFVRAFACDGSSKSIMVDEKMTIGEVIAVLADKNHVPLTPDLAVIEHMPELFMERILEDHDSLVDNMAMWTRDTKNQILFETRPQKNDLFKCPERYLLVSSSSEKGASLDPKRRENLIQEYFSSGVVQVPEVEGVLYIKSDGKKAWKKYFCVLRASGLYYNPKGKVSKSSRDLACLIQFEYVELYNGLSWKKKYHAPTDFCFALKHPQIQKKTSKFIRYLCAENKAALDQWIMGIRIAKFGKQLLTNFDRLKHEILTWETRDSRTSVVSAASTSQAIAELNPEGALRDSRLSMPEPGSRHSLVNVKNSMLVHAAHGYSVEEGVNSDRPSRTPERKSSLTGTQANEIIKSDKLPVKRVSFSNTHSVINDSGEETIPHRHRDSITSASTDSSEESASSGEGRMNSIAHRGSKMRPKLPVTTGTTRQISEMVQTSMDGGSTGSGSLDGSLDEWKIPSVGVKELSERRKSAPVCNSADIYGERRLEGQGRDHRSMSQTVQYEQLPMSPSPISPQQMKGPKGVMLSQKGARTHSRGSSISSVDSSDSYQGHLLSPTSPTGGYGYIEYNQSSWPLYETLDSPQTATTGGQGQVMKQAPPTAHKPGSNKKPRPISGPATGPVEKGHRRNTSNTSKSSLESVEEVPRESLISSPCPVFSPSLSRSSVTPPLPPPPVMRPNSGSLPSTPSTPLSAPVFSNQNPQYPSHGTATAIPSSVGHRASPIMMPESSRPMSPVSQSRCLSPRLSIHRPCEAKPIAPPSVPMTPPTVPMTPPSIPYSAPPPPPLVPPTPHNPITGVKTHKKRPSGGNIVVNGNQVMGSMPQGGATYQDIVSSPPPWSPSMTSARDQMSLNQDQGQCVNTSDDTNYAPLPFMAELNKHMHKMPPPPPPPQSSATVHSESADVKRLPPETLPKPNDDQRQRVNGSIQYSSHEQNMLNQSSCSGSAISSPSVNKQTVLPPHGRKQAPPPPPKRSESTKLSSSVSGVRTSAGDSVNVPNDIAQLVNDPLYDNCDGIVDISDLPPPPPELLEDLRPCDGDDQYSEVMVPPASSSSGRVKPPPPPPPPKRSKDTQLSSSQS